MTKKKKQRGIQLECDCSAYRFPHRMGGGKCDGVAMVEKFRWEGDQRICELCVERHDQGCNVIDGLESHQYCEQFRRAINDRR